MTSVDATRPCSISAPPAVRLVVDYGEQVCRDCDGGLVIVDDDGSVSGTVGGLIDCWCVELSVPPGFVECQGCASLIRVHDPRLAEYLAFCEAAGMEPAWCMRCGDYRPLANGVRAHCRCTAVPDRSNEVILGSFTVAGPWGIER
jgi:hypothetical protein